MSLNKQILLILFFIVIGLFINCSTVNAPLLTNAPNCSSSVEGFYYCTDQWSGNTPAILIKDNDNYKIIEGEIISYNDQSVEFDPGKESPFYDPEPKRFDFKDIVTLIGNDGEIIYGTIPQKYSKAYSLELFLSSLSNPEKKPVTLNLQPNQRFAFCVPPDNYNITRILFKDKKNNIDEAIDYPELVLNIKDGCSNYIGHLMLNPKSSKLENPIILPYKILSRPTQSSTAGILGGAIGGALHAAAMASKGIIGEHKLFIGSDNNFTSEGSMPQKNNLINVKNFNIQE